MRTILLPPGVNPVHHHHHISVMELGHLLTLSGLTYPEVSSKVCHDSFWQLENSVSLPWVIYYEAFYLHVVSLNMMVQRLNVAILPLELPCSGPVTIRLKYQLLLSVNNAA
jgi:hypothetical protein